MYWGIPFGHLKILTNSGFAVMPIISRSSDLTISIISGSGNSPNVVAALEYANSIGCRTLALTGRDGGKLGALAQLNIQAPVPHMGRIEDAHMIVCHMIGYRFMEE